MPASKGPRWNAAATEELVCLYNLFITSGGQDGCDPENQDPSYVVEQLKDNERLRPFLQASNGGHSSHKNNSKALRGYSRAASEYITFLAKKGIRRKDYPKFLEDQALTGQRQQEEASLDGSASTEACGSDEDSSEEEEDDDDGAAALAIMPTPSKKLSTAKSPPLKQKAKASTPRKKKDADGDVESVVQGLSGVTITMKDGVTGVIDDEQAYPFVVFQARDEFHVQFAYVRMQLASDVNPKMVSCKIADDGLTVRVTVKKRIHKAALLDPDFLLMKYQAHGFDSSDPLYQSLRSLKRSYAESKEFFERVVVVPLPFPCDKSGFYDPPSYSGDPLVGIQVGVYPLDVDKHLDGDKIASGAPHPSIIFLTFACRELHLEKLFQQAQGASFFATADTGTTNAGTNSNLVPDGL